MTHDLVSNVKQAGETRQLLVGSSDGLIPWCRYKLFCVCFVHDISGGLDHRPRQMQRERRKHGDVKFNRLGPFLE